MNLQVQVQLTFSKKKTQCAQMEPYLSHGQRQKVNTTDNGKICHCRCFTEASSTLEDVPRLPLEASMLHPLQPTVPPWRRLTRERRARIRMCQKIVQLSPNVNPLDSRTQITTLLPKNTDAYTCVENVAQQPRSSNTTYTCFAHNVLRPLTETEGGCCWFCSDSMS